MHVWVALLAAWLAAVAQVADAFSSAAKRTAREIASMPEHRPFDLDTAILCASKSFQAYVTPQEGAAVRVLARNRATEFVAPKKKEDKLSSPLSSDATSLTLCWHSRNFIKDCFLGELVLELESVRGLKPEEDLGQKVLTGAARDLYVVAWLSPNSVDGSKDSDALALPVNVARSATKWRLDETEDGVAALGGEKLILPIPLDVAPACTDVVLLLMDENIGKEDEMLGHTKLPLSRVLVPAGKQPRPVKFDGQLDFKVPSPLGPGALGGAVIGGVVAGPMGAAVGAGAAAMLRGWKSDAKLRLKANFRWAGENDLDFGRSNLDIMTETAKALGRSEEESTRRARTPYQLLDATRELMDKAQVSLRVATNETNLPLIDQIVERIKEADEKNEKNQTNDKNETIAVEAGAEVEPGAASNGSASAMMPAEPLDRLCGKAAATLMVAGTGENWTTICVDTKDTTFELMASVDELETDTQCMLWRSEERKEVILAFRGTEQDKWRDLVTDATVVQERWDDTAPKPKSKTDQGGEELMCHAGFKRAYMSVRGSIRSLICAAGLADETSKREAVLKAFRGEAIATKGKYRLVCTGHSLGGALATLAAADLVWSGAASHFGEVEVYTYGAPRVGNRAFCEAVNEAVPSIYRVVNGQDVIARLPRGALAASLGSWRDTLYGALDYSHPGVPVLVDERQAICLVGAQGLREVNDALPRHVLEELEEAAEDPSLPPDSASKVPIGSEEKEEQLKDGLALLEDLEKDPFSDPLGEGSLLTDLSQEIQDILSQQMQALEEYQNSRADGQEKTQGVAEEVALAARDQAGSLFDGVKDSVQGLVRNLNSNMKQLTDAGDRFDEMRRTLSEQLSERLASSVPQEELLTLVGLRREFWDAEMELLRSITTGQAVTHHLEPSYFIALTKAKAKGQGDEEQESLAAEEVVVLPEAVEP